MRTETNTLNQNRDQYSQLEQRPKLSIRTIAPKPKWLSSFFSFGARKTNYNEWVKNSVRDMGQVFKIQQRSTKLQIRKSTFIGCKCILKLTTLSNYNSNLTSIFRVYKEKIVKNDLYWRTQRLYHFRKLQFTTRIIKNQFYFEQNHSDITTYSHRLFFVFNNFLLIDAQKEERLVAIKSKNFSP